MKENSLFLSNEVQIILKWFIKKITVCVCVCKANIAKCEQLVNISEEYMGVHCTILATFL